MTIVPESGSRALVRVLSDIATDLASMQDIEDVFLAIVQRTRAITGADMAYLSLNDHERGETYIRKSDGVRTADYRAIRMPLGTGVLGKAATGLASVTTTAYCEDDSLVHLPEIDRIVRHEGVQSILGLPMNVHGRLQGALLIADRKPVSYSANTIALVDAIARQAAVAIFYAAKVKELTDTAAALDAQADAGEARLRVLQTVFQQDQRLVEAVAARGGPNAVLAVLSEIYGAPVVFIGPEGAPGDLSVTRALQTAAAGGKAAPVQTPDGPMTVAAAEIGKRSFGYVLARGILAPEDRTVLEHGALYLAMALLIERFDTEQSTKGGLLDELIRAGSELSSALRGRLVQAGLSPHEPLAIMVLQSDLDTVELIRRLRRGLPRPIITSHEHHVCVLHQGAPLGEYTQQRLSDATTNVQIGTASVHDLNVAHAHRSAELALANLRMLGGNVLDGDALGALGVLFEAEQDSKLTESVLAPIQPLLRLPRGKELARTAWAYLEFGPKVTTVAARLFIHPNTLRQRIARIAGVLGTDWHSGPQKLGLHIALRAFVLREVVDEGAS